VDAPTFARCVWRGTMRRARAPALAFALARVNARARVAIRASSASTARMSSSSSYAAVTFDALDAVSVDARDANASNQSFDCVVYGVAEGDIDGKGAIACDDLRAFDDETGGVVQAMIDENEFKGKSGTSAFSRAARGRAKHVGVVGLGSAHERTRAQTMEKLGAIASANAQKMKCVTLGIRGANANANACAAGAYLGAMEDQRFKSKPQVKTLKTVSLLEVVADVSAGKARAQGVQLTKDLVAAPANVVTPTAMAEVAKSIAAQYPDCMTVEILEKEDCRKLGMGSYLGVAEASDEPPKFIHLTYRGAGSDLRKVAVVGKGLTFDSGGYNIKTGPGSMIEMMKFDMGGAGAALGAAKIIGATKPAGVEAHFIIASCENMIGSRGLRPGDILTASNGKTIEVNNTDAEGRLTLADALVFAEKNCGATAIVDVATLTGAIIVALGDTIAGLFSPTDAAAKRMEDAAKEAGEETWRMPMPDSMWPIMKSEIADMKNTGSRGGGSITAALFLKQYVSETTEWAHWDIAGPVWNDKAGGATGFGAATLATWVASFAKK